MLAHLSRDCLHFRIYKIDKITESASVLPGNLYCLVLCIFPAVMIDWLTSK